MNLASIGLAYLRRRKASTWLNVSLLAFAVAAVTLVVLTSAQLEERMYREARDVDLVVGAKGSQTQMILSSLYGIDVPTGAMPWVDADAIGRRPGVAKAIPIALVDTYVGYRIVGTTHDYVAHYQAPLAKGRLWEAPMEAVLGADVYARLLRPVDSLLVASHGLDQITGEHHTDAPYRVVGVLAHTGTLVDKLILTDVLSVWLLHAGDGRAREGALVAEPVTGIGPSISALLLKLWDADAEREIVAYMNSYRELQWASPMREAERLFGIAAVGVELMRAFAAILIFTAALSMLVALYNGFNERLYDLAVMRTVGATREDVMLLLLFEGVMLALAAALLGLVLGHLLTTALGMSLRNAQQISVTGATWYWSELWIVGGTLLVGVGIALIPAWRAHEVDIAAKLARG